MDENELAKRALALVPPNVVNGIVPGLMFPVTSGDPETLSSIADSDATTLNLPGYNTDRDLDVDDIDAEQEALVVSPPEHINAEEDVMPPPSAAVDVADAIEEVVSSPEPLMNGSRKGTGKAKGTPKPKSTAKPKSKAIRKRPAAIDAETLAVFRPEAPEEVGVVEVVDDTPARRRTKHSKGNHKGDGQQIASVADRRGRSSSKGGKGKAKKGAEEHPVGEIFGPIHQRRRSSASSSSNGTKGKGNATGKGNHAALETIGVESSPSVIALLSTKGSEKGAADREGRLRRTLSCDDLGRAPAAPAEVEESTEHAVEPAAEMDGVPAAAVQELTPQVPETRPMMMPNPHADFQRFAIPCPKIVNGPVETVFCNWCHLPVEKGKVRLTSKSQEKYKCHRCSSTFAKCNKEKGVWPTAEFKEFEEQEQTEFYRKAGELSKSSDVVKLMTFTLNKYQKKEFSWANGGQYLPLKVWVTQGFDGDRIVRTSTPEDIQENAQAGTCYRVRLFSTIETGTTGWQTSQSLSSQSGDINRTATPQLTSSTAAETREQFADRLKKEKLQRAATDKEENKKRATAIQLLKKLASPVEKLTNTLAAGSAKNLPAALKAPADDMCKHAKKLQEELSGVIGNPKAAQCDLAKQQEVSNY